MNLVAKNCVVAGAMQPATRPSIPHSLYHNPYHPGLFSARPTAAAINSSTGPQDYELKRQYLALLPPQQIIDICLAFDVHIPPYIKSTVWPLDLKAAIAVLSKTSRPSESESSPTRTDNVPVMDSLTESQVDAPDKPPAAAPSTEKLPSAPPNSAEAAPIPSTSDSKTQPAQNSYPFASYPHVPYYAPPPAGYSPYPHPYPGYLPPNGHPVPHPPGYPPHPLLAGGTATQPSQPHDPYSTQSSDDLPSYEEMIVEALAESTDTEGCAPKDLFTWMASRYPLQSNFRPSASQALQKAYKRGRFEKTSSGKYKLNVTWEGGNVRKHMSFCVFDQRFMITRLLGEPLEDHKRKRSQPHRALVRLLLRRLRSSLWYIILINQQGCDLLTRDSPTGTPTLPHPVMRLILSHYNRRYSHLLRYRISLLPKKTLTKLLRIY